MMLVLLALAQAATSPASTPVLGPIGRQAMPAKGCAAFLWNANDRQLVAMVLADPAQLRLSIDGRTADYARIEQAGQGGLGFAGVARYRSGTVTATLDLTVKERAGLQNGAAIPTATLTVARDGGDTIVVPAAGLIGCAETAPAAPARSR